MSADGRAAVDRGAATPDGSPDAALPTVWGRPAARRLRALGRRAVKLSLLMGTGSYRSALFGHGVAATTEHRGAPFSSDFRTVVDVGAARGQFALFALRNWPEARVYCFEPLPKSATLLARMLGDRVELHQVALGEHPGSCDMNVARRDDSSSILAQKWQAQEYPGTRATARVRVRLARLDDVLEPGIARPALLKLDVQGYEAAVLRGATRTLSAIDEVLCECSFLELYEGQPTASAIVAEMQSAGFTLVGVGPASYGVSGQPLQADFLFRRVRPR